MATAIASNLAAVALLITAAASVTCGGAAYTNHTVGGPVGWLFNATANSSAANYSAWAAAQKFGLGDFLIFKTNTNQTVVQTYNLTTYINCTADYSSDNDTFVYNGGSSSFGTAQTVAVPLTIEGRSYFFSDADDGAQCQRGMAFAIDVSHGLGLPPSLNQPPPPPYKGPSPPPDSTESPPVTVAQPQQPGGASTVDANFRGVLFCVASIAASILAH